MTSSHPHIGTSRELDRAVSDQCRLLLEESGCLSLPVGVVRATAPDALDLLHRLSTNAIINLPPQHSRSTVLTTEKGKILDQVVVANLSDHILLITGNGRGCAVKDWIQRFIITEHIEVCDVTSHVSSLFAIGPKVLPWLESVLGIPAPEGEGVGRSEIFNDLIAVRDALWPLPAYHLLFPSTHDQSVLKTAERSTRFVSRAAFESVRMHCSVPQAGTEITEMMNPLEAGLSTFVSFTKGCYVGQEVIARIDSYGKLQQQLSKFVIGGNIDPEMLPGARIVLGASDVGYLTSAARSPEGRETLALGYLRTKIPHHSFKISLGGALDELPCRLVDGNNP